MRRGKIEMRRKNARQKVKGGGQRVGGGRVAEAKNHPSKGNVQQAETSAKFYNP
jgi:hypothetical protein